MNLYLWQIDAHVLRNKKNELHEKVNANRFCDDISISGHDPNAIKVVIDQIENDAQSLHLPINEKKRLIFGPGQIRLVQGVDVRNRLGTRINKRDKANAINAAHIYLTAAKNAEPEDLGTLIKQRRIALGYRNHCAQARIGPAHTVNNYIKFGDRAILKKLHAVQIFPKNGKWWAESKHNNPANLSMIWRRHIGGCAIHMESMEINQNSN